MLDAGIDVLSTVNVQHLESLNDQVAELSGVRVRETIPDSVLGRADEVVLIDLTPEALLDRACAPARSTRPSASRPRSTASSGSRTSPRCARSRCARSPRRSRPSGWSPRSSARARTCCRRRCRRPSASGCSRSSSPTRARSGSSAAPGARPSASAPSSTCSGSRRPGATPDAEQERQLQALRQLASVLGADLLVEPGDDVADDRRAASPASAARPTSCSGRSRPARGLARLRVPLPQRLMRGAARRRRPDRRRPLAATREDAMSTAVVVAVVVVAFAGGAAAGWFAAARERGAGRRGSPRGTRRILLPFTGTAISRRALDAALRLARAEDATLMPAFLATRAAPRSPLDAPLPAPVRCRRCRCSRRSSSARARRASPSTRASAAGAPTATRCSRLLDEEPVDRVIVSATANPRKGLSADDLEWLLEQRPGRGPDPAPGPRGPPQADGRGRRGPLLEAVRTGSYVM